MGSSRKQVIFLGNLPLATKVLRRLDDDPRVDVVGVVCETVPRSYLDAFDEPSVVEEAQARQLRLLTLTEVIDSFSPGSLDFAVSCRAPYLLRRTFLEHFKKGVVNFHGGPLPELRGVDAANHAILLGLKESAGTIHYMSPGIDEGPILRKASFSIDEEDTSYDVFVKTQRALLNAFEDLIDDLVTDSETCVPQNLLLAQGAWTKYYRRRDLDQFRSVDPTLPAEEISRRARAFDFPGHERAHLAIGDAKVYITPEAKRPR